VSTVAGRIGRRSPQARPPLGGVRAAAARRVSGSLAGSAASIGIVACVMLLLFGPLVLLAVFSFNSSTIISLPFERFTTHWYQEAFTNSGARDSMVNSVVVALIVAAVCLVIGTMAAIGLTRTRFRLRGAAAALHGAPLVVPSLIIGVAAVMFFSTLHVELSLTTLTLMHIGCTFPLVTAIVAAGLVRFERAPEEAAIDLGASQWQMVRHVMIPQIAPSLAAAGLYAFFESFNSFELSFFTCGYQQTFPVWVYALLKHGDNLPIINAAATFIAAVQVLIVIAGWVLVRRLLRRQAEGRALSDVVMGARS
jgi:spermidine/putrescine transport system permease protein